ncbi:hypothetical protein GLAREA_08212 [Glarea lozoyensis ATCC 20868]|uniref:Uncharacterized protein n=1 Tax=Glarea lozoyensis (strain ATCC 20868 / MF5171) TaxID=1116229 RepID=S3CEE4_GLAL2|nr:uncharacterized protein GLAREA_08212 [Glarea lozoyensis ATCC 20868]EPE24360.1 hypothetical protein GLAREA_08212 [Glarea lozoyensis ATCC 20868]
MTGGRLLVPYVDDSPTTTLPVHYDSNVACPRCSVSAAAVGGIEWVPISRKFRPHQEHETSSQRNAVDDGRQDSSYGATPARTSSPSSLNSPRRENMDGARSVGLAGLYQPR